MPKHRIATPELVQFHYETAGLATRSMAWLLDQVIITAFRVVIIAGLILSRVSLGIALGFVMLFALDFGYYVLFEMKEAGQTPGKRALGLRVVSARGGILCFGDVFVRNLLRPLDTLPLCMLLGGTVAFLDPLRRRLGDLAAETLVVRDARNAIPEMALAQQSRVNTFQGDPAVRGRILSRVTREERDLIFDLVLRRDQLVPEARQELFRMAAGRFRERYSLPGDLDHLSDEQTVVNLALVLQKDRFTA